MTSAIASPVRIAPEDFFEVPGWERYELVDGELVESPEINTESSTVAMLIDGLLGDFVCRHRLGIVAGSDATYQRIENDSSRIRRPDVSYIADGRPPQRQYDRGLIRIAPETAVGVVSLYDEYDEVGAKVEEYLAAGVRLGWVVNPRSQAVIVHHPSQASSRLRSADRLMEEDVLPEFSVQLPNCFRIRKTSCN